MHSVGVLALFQEKLLHSFTCLQLSPELHTINQEGMDKLIFFIKFDTIQNCKALCHQVLQMLISLKLNLYFTRLYPLHRNLTILVMLT